MKNIFKILGCVLIIVLVIIGCCEAVEDVKENTHVGIMTCVKLEKISKIKSKSVKDHILGDHTYYRNVEYEDITYYAKFKNTDGNSFTMEVDERQYIDLEKDEIYKVKYLKNSYTYDMLSYKKEKYTKNY